MLSWYIGLPGEIKNFQGRGGDIEAAKGGDWRGAAPAPQLTKEIRGSVKDFFGGQSQTRALVNFKLIFSPGAQLATISIRSGSSIVKENHTTTLKPQKNARASIAPADQNTINTLDFPACEMYEKLYEKATVLT